MLNSFKQPQNNNLGMKQYTLFFSWQNDKKKAKKLIKEALIASQATLKDEGIELRIDEDTRGRAGNRDIVREVLDKINKCDIFLADVTPVTTLDKKDGKRLPKHMPNSNVMFEYGYALHSKGEERMITLALLASDEFIEHMPFDINHNTLSSFKDSDGLKNLSEWIKNIIQEVDKERERQLPEYACRVIFADTRSTQISISPSFLKTVFVDKKPQAEVPQQFTDLEKATKLTAIAQGTPKKTVQAFSFHPIKSQTNKSLVPIQLLFTNWGLTALDNCNITVTADNEKVYFKRTNKEETMISTIFRPSNTRLNDTMVVHHVDTINPGDSSFFESFFIYAPHNVGSFRLYWALSSRTYRDNGYLDVSVSPVYEERYQENNQRAGEEKITVLIETE